jgi:serine/threonine protein kinase
MFAVGAAKGMAHLHKLKILHRDLKSGTWHMLSMAFLQAVSAPPPP